jgi:cytochrome b561
LLACLNWTSALVDTLPSRTVRGWRNEIDAYGRVSQFFHWLVAALMIAVVLLGLMLDQWPRGNPTRESVILVHKSIGLIILALAALRLSWLLRSPAPPAAGHLKTWERRTAWFTHKLLYFLMFALPLSGILLSQAVGKPISHFGWLTLPQLLPIDHSTPPSQQTLVIIGGILHKIVFKFALFAAFGLHIGGVLKHAFLDRDPAMFRRMWGR